MEDQYGMGDLRQYMNGRLLFHGIQQQTSQDDDLCSNPSHPSYDMLLFRLDNATNYNNNNSSSSSAAAAADATTTTYHHRMATVHGNNSSDGGNNNAGLSQHHVLESVDLRGDVNNNNNGRWPRQETLTLLEIRSRLDSKFKEANQKGPLWDELSRIMAEEHGYQRSGKKCREKFENLYKYYKKTKEGKAGRQDGKHYRFFRQLEALYGEAQNSTNSTSEAHFVGGNFHYSTSIDPPAAGEQDTPQRHNKLSDRSLSLSNYSESDETTSSEDDCDLNIKDPTAKKLQIGKKKSWKAKINDFMDAQMKKLMAKQEAWMEKMVITIEQKEQERMIREEEWRKQDSARIEREHEFWANERAWIEARDSALMDALQKISGNNNKGHQFIIRASSPHQEDNGIDETMNNINKNDKRDIWPECEISRLIQLRNAMEVRFQRRLVSDDVLWEEIANKMACFGHDRSGLTCKDKWDSVNNYVIKCNKRRKENSPSSSKSCTDAYYHSCLHRDDSFSNQGGESLSYCNEQRADHVMRLNKHLVNLTSTSPNNNADNNASESSLRFFMGDDYGRNDGLVERSYNQRFNI